MFLEIEVTQSSPSTLQSVGSSSGKTFGAMAFLNTPENLTFLVQSDLGQSLGLTNVMAGMFLLFNTMPDGPRKLKVSWLAFKLKKTYEMPDLISNASAMRISIQDPMTFNTMTADMPAIVPDFTEAVTVFRRVEQER